MGRRARRHRAGRSTRDDSGGRSRLLDDPAYDLIRRCRIFLAKTHQLHNQLVDISGGERGVTGPEARASQEDRAP